jgi:hypothetical protein
MPETEREVIGVEGWKVKVPESGKGEFEVEFIHDISVHPQKRKEVRDLLRHLKNIYGYKIDYTLASNHRWSPEKNALLVRNLDGRDLRLLCIEVDSKFLEALATFYSPQQTPEHRLIDRCIQDLYENGKLSEEAAKHLKLLQGALRLCKYYPREPSGELDAETAQFLNRIQIGSANRYLLLSDDKVKEIQHIVKAPITGNYGLGTIVKVAEYQESLKGEDLYKGEVNGLWTDETRQAHQERQEKSGTMIRVVEFGEREFNSKENLLLPSVIDAYSAPDALFVGDAARARYEEGCRSRGEEPEMLVLVGVTEKDGKLENVWISPGGKLWEEVQRAEYLDNLLKDSERGGTNTLQEVAQELARHGLTPEFVEKMDTLLEIEMIFLPTAGGTGRISKSGANKVVRALVHKHHPIPKYLGGRLKQKLDELPAWLHWKYHGNLSRELGARNVEEAMRLVANDPERRIGVAKKMIAFTEKFDKEYSTKILDYLKHELIEQKWLE